MNFGFSIMFRLQETFAVKKGSSICIASSGLKFLFLNLYFSSELDVTQLMW